MNSNIYKILLVLALSVFITNCAKRGRPTGGLKDSIAPILISAYPDHKSINFKSKKIKISFDEYIKLKDINKQLVISPPLKYPPIITPVGTASKDINIKLLDTLKENTTYTFNFGNSVVDNNEENKLKRFKYIFSTGTYIDSLKIEGAVLDAFHKKTDTDIAVLLYEINEQFNDSIIFKEKPTYVTSTLDSTNFDLSNLKAGKYLLIALKQPSNNYIYNPKQDKIGFVKEPISIPSDSLFNITLFKEIAPFKLFKPVEANKGHIIFGYEGDSKNLAVQLVDETPTNFKQEFVFEKGKDTLNYWFNAIEKDSLTFDVTNDFNFKQTVSVKLRSSKLDSLKLTKNISSILEYRDTISISSNIPIIKIDESKIILQNKDSISIPFSTKLDVYKTKLYINFDKEYRSQYALQLLPKSIIDVFENTNDTLSYKFTTKPIESYGIINLTVSNVTSPIIIEVLNDKLEVVASEKMNENKTLNFNNLLPNKYVIRAIIDANNNGYWDTGNFLKKLQPEKVQYFNLVIELRANWDLNETFILK